MSEGSCLCGGVTFEVRGEILNPRYCHCANCRKFAGTAPAAWALVRTEDFVVTSPEAHVTRYDSGGGLRVFCATCGSSLWYEPKGLEQYRGVALGAFDSGPVPAPTMHLWTKSKAAWVSVTDGLMQHETFPANR